MTTYTTVDRIALTLSGVLATLGIVVSGLVETFTGKPYGATPLTNDAGEIVATPTVDPQLRTGLVIAGLVVFTLWGGYRLLTARVADPRESSDAHATAD
jgi:hypothetical protein